MKKFSGFGDKQRFLTSWGFSDKNFVFCFADQSELLWQVVDNGEEADGEDVVVDR